MQASYFQLAHKLYTNTLTKMDTVKKYLEQLGMQFYAKICVLTPNIDSTSTHRFTVEGYLAKKRPNMTGDKRYWLVLKEGRLTLLKGKKVC